MEQDEAIKGFESLASGVRLDIYRLLMRQGPEGLVAGQIASTLDIPPTNLSFHLKALTHAGLLGVTPEGRFQRYRANLSLMQDLIEYLTAECCAGHPEECAELHDAACEPVACSPSKKASVQRTVGHQS